MTKPGGSDKVPRKVPSRVSGRASEKALDKEPGGIGSRRLYTGRVISLDLDTVRFPNGTVGEIEIIRHSGASAIIPFLTEPAGPEPEVLLIRQYRYAAAGYVYEIPAGRLDAGELPEACAARELTEETGYVAARLTALTTIFTTPGFTDEQIHLFSATGLTKAQRSLELDEFLDVEPMRFSRAVRMIELGEIRDGKTIAGLLYAATFCLAGNPVLR